jgi:hypothetical protein
LRFGGHRVTAWRLVPTISTVPRRAVSWRTNLAASWNIGSDFSRLMMWILLRWPKMNGAILGFQKRVWCPKWTPASSISRMVTDMVFSSKGWD